MNDTCSKKFLLIIGGNRCGTTSIYHYLSGHPQIIPTIEKESRFFLDSDYEINRRSKFPYDGRMDTYLKFFPDNAIDEESHWYLDSSPGFLYSRGTPDRIKDFFINHRVALVALLRDPIDRFMSWYKYDKQLGNIPQDMTMEKYYEKNVKAETKKPYNRLKTGCYSQYLNRYYELFPENLFVYRFEELKDNPNKLVKKILGEIEVDTDYVIEDTSPRNKSRKTRSELLNNLYMETRKRFQNAIPSDSWLYKLLRKGSKTYQKFNYKSSDDDIKLDREMRDKLEKYYEDEYQKLMSI